MKIESNSKDLELEDLSKIQLGLPLQAVAIGTQIDSELVILEKAISDLQAHLVPRKAGR